MFQMICTHRIRDFEVWQAVFREQAWARAEAGLHIRHVLRDTDDPDLVCMWFDVEDAALARAFMASPEAERAGKAAGVVGSVQVFVVIEDNSR